MKIIKALILCLFLSSILTVQAHSATCYPPALKFYTHAKKKGWKFNCYLKHAYYFDITSSITFLPLPTGEIACVGHTGRSGFPLLAKLNFNAPGRPALSGGWRVENFQAKLQGFGSAYKLQKEIGNYMFSAKLETRGNAITPFKIIIKKIKVKHDTSLCSQFYDQAF